MVKIICPECGAKSEFRKKELPLYGRVECQNCGVLLQVIDDGPIEVEVLCSECSAILRVESTNPLSLSEVDEEDLV